MCLLVCLCLTPEPALAGGVGLQAHWLWSSRYPRAGETIRLRREFTIPGGHNIATVTSARRFTTEAEILDLLEYLRVGRR